MTTEEYLKQHGISKETADAYDITWDENYLHIPITDADGNEIFTKSRYLHYTDEGDQPKYKNSQGSKATLFNFYAVKDSKTLVITEGEMDTIKLMQEDIPAVSSTGGASTFPKDFVKNLADKKVYICFDNDNAGVEGTKKALGLLPHAKVINLPEGTKDVCDYFVKGNTNFADLMKKAQTREQWEVRHIPEEHTLIDGEELSKMKFDQAPWLIEGILYSEGFCFLYGAEGTGKSFMTLSMAQAVATGKPWLDHFETHQVNVLFIDKENPPQLISKRNRGLDGITKNMFWLKQPQTFTLHNGAGGLSQFAYDVATQVRAHRIGLIVFDSLVDVMVGNANTAEDTQLFFDAVRELFPNVAFLPIHHENKPAQGTYRNSAQRLRGSTNINAQAFTMFRLESVNKSKIDLTLEQTKARDEQKLDKFMIQMIVEPNPDGKGTIVKGFEYMGAVPNNSSTDEGSKSSEAREAIINALSTSESGISRQMALGLSSSDETADRTLDDLQKEGIIKKVRQGREVYFFFKRPIVGEADAP